MQCEDVDQAQMVSHDIMNHNSGSFLHFSIACDLC